MSRSCRVVPLVAVVSTIALAAAWPHRALASPVVGKLELPPPPERPPVVARGFLDRVENPLAKVRPMAVAPYLVVALEADAPPEFTGQVTWDLVGESFAQPVLAAPVGAEIVIRNSSKTSRTLVAAEDPALIPSGPINPTGPKSFRVGAPKVYTIGDRDAPHLRGKLVVVATTHLATVDASGKFELDVPPGSYKLRVFYRDRWVDRPEQIITVPARGKLDLVTVKGIAVPAGK